MKIKKRGGQQGKNYIFNTVNVTIDLLQIPKFIFCLFQENEQKLFV